MPLILAVPDALFHLLQGLGDGTRLFVGAERFPPTATPSGDAVQVTALARFTRSDRPVRRPSRPIGRWLLSASNAKTTPPKAQRRAGRGPNDRWRARRVARLAHDASRWSGQIGCGENHVGQRRACVLRGTRVPVRCPADGEGTGTAAGSPSCRRPRSRDVARARARRSPAESLLEGSVARTSLGALNNRNTARHDNPPRLCSTPRDSQTNVATLRNAVSEQDSPPTSRRFTYTARR